MYVIGACGFDSIPADLGQICVKREMEGEVNSIETYLKVIIPDLPGAAINFATWQVISSSARDWNMELCELTRALSMDLLTPKSSEA